MRVEEKGHLYRNLPSTRMVRDGRWSSVHHSTKHLTATAMSCLPQATQLPVSLLFS